MTVYALLDGEEPFYVGLTTTTVMKRLSGHRQATRRGEKAPVCKRIRDIEAAGREVGFRVLQVKGDKAAETYWITRLIAEGHVLLNRQFVPAVHLLPGLREATTLEITLPGELYLWLSTYTTDGSPSAIGIAVQAYLWQAYRRTKRQAGRQKKHL